MAGYVFSIGADNDNKAQEIVVRCVEDGVFSTFIKKPSNRIVPAPYEGTIADYLTMKEGDNVYFFSKRKYYGIGEIINIGIDCKYSNYPDSIVPEFPEHKDIKDTLLYDLGEESCNYKWLCTFKESPAFFTEGIDADDILRYKPETFKMLRAFWNVSFIKIGEEENQSLKEIILLRHQKEFINGERIVKTNSAIHDKIRSKRLEEYLIRLQPYLDTCCKGEKITHEMALEAATVDALVKGTSDIMGKWDYVSHQVIASPFKPINYMDRIDVFAYNFLLNTKIPCQYLVAELKRDAADIDTVDQVMKYIDWVCNEYAYGDYGVITAYIIAYSFGEDVIEHVKKNVKRYYTHGIRPTKNETWNNIKLIEYRYKDGKVKYSLR